MEGFSKKSFDTYLKMVSDFDSTNPLIKNSSYSEKEKHIFSDQDIEIFINQLSEVNKNTFSSEYVKTMISFPVVRKHLFFHVESNEVLLDRIISSLKKSRDKIIESDYSMYSLRRLANRHSPSSHPFHKVTIELYEYLYRDRNKENNEKRILKEKVNAYLKLCDEISEALKNSSMLSDAFDISPNQFTEGRSPARFIRSRIDRVDIEKNSSKLREKIFVQRMIKINERFYRQPKLNMIQELMCLPFFERQYDPTTLSRIRKNMQ